MDTSIAAGVPIALFAKIKSNQTGRSLGNIEYTQLQVSVDDTHTCEYDFVFNQTASDEEIYEREFTKIINLIDEGYTASVVTVGSADSEKKEVTQGLTHLIVESLFQHCSHQSANSQTEIQVMAVEIVEDTITDLTYPSKHGLALHETENGPELHGMNRERLTFQFESASQARANIDTFHNWFETVCDNRTKILTDFGKKSECATFVFHALITTVIQNETNVPTALLDSTGQMTDNTQILKRQLLCCELPSIDKLVFEKSPHDLRLREGPVLNKELIGMMNLLNESYKSQYSFNSSENGSLPYEDCKTNTVLLDTFGGNSLTFALVCFNADESRKEVNQYLLGLSSKMKELYTFPLPNDATTCGLLSKHFLRYQNVVSQLEALRTTQNQSGLELSSSTRLVELKKLILLKDKEVQCLHKDKEQLREAYAQFRKKYSSLLEAKTDLQKSLIESESKNLDVSKALIDLRIENNELKKNESDIRAELETKLITTENEIIQGNVTIQKRSEELEKLRKELETVKENSKSINIEYLALRNNYVELNEAHDTLKAEQSEINLQLINLVNSNDALEKDNFEKSQKYDEMRKMNEKLTDNNHELSNQNAEMQAEMNNLRIQLEKSSLEVVRQQVEVKKFQTELSETKTGLNKDWIEYQQSKEADIKKLNDEWSIEKDNLIKDNERLIKELQNIRSELKLNDNKLQEFNSEKQKLVDQNGQQMKTIHKLERQIEDKTREYQDRLVGFLQEIELIQQGGIIDLTSAALDSRAEAGDSVKNDMYNELLKVHHQNQSDLAEEIEFLRNNQKIVIQERLNIESTLIKVLTFVDSLDLDEQRKEMNEIVSLNQIKNEHNVLLSNFHKENDRLVNRVKTLKQELENEKSNHLRTMKEKLNEMTRVKNEYKEFKQQHIHCDLAGITINKRNEYEINLQKLKELQIILANQIDTNKQLIEKGMGSTITVKPLPIHFDTTSAMFDDGDGDHQRRRKKKVKRKKRRSKMEDDGSEICNVDAHSMLEDDLADLKSENRSLEKENKDLRKKSSTLQKELRKAKQGGGSGGAGSGAREGDSADMEEAQQRIEELERMLEKSKEESKKKEEKLKSKITELRNEITTTKTITKTKKSKPGKTVIISEASKTQQSANPDAEGWERLAILEQEKAELISKLNAAEEELKTVHQHYQGEITKYKKEISQLKKKLKGK